MAKDHEKVLIFIISEEYMKTEMYYHYHWKINLRKSLVFVHVLQREVILCFESLVFFPDYLFKDVGIVYRCGRWK